MNKFTLPVVVTSLLAISIGFTPTLAGSETPAQHKTHNHDAMNHGQMQHDQKAKVNFDKVVLPTEPGQGAFATIAEIVVILTNDPNTDWNKVDIDGLREHLVDMSELSLHATAVTAVYDNKVVFTVTGTGRTKKAIQSMVPAHAGVLAQTTPWNIVGKLTSEGATLTITSDNPAVLQTIKALGFYGVMATGAHHQAHHLAMARGDRHIHAHE